MDKHPGFAVGEYIRHRKTRRVYRVDRVTLMTKLVDILTSERVFLNRCGFSNYMLTSKPS